MIEDSKYVIVPDFRTSGASNSEGDDIANLIKGGYSIKARSTTKEAVHYVMVKYKRQFEGEGKVA